MERSSRPVWRAGRSVGADGEKGPSQSNQPKKLAASAMGLGLLTDSATMANSAALPRQVPRALEIIEEQERIHTARGTLVDYAHMLLVDLPSLVDRPQVLDRALKLIIRSGLRRSALEAVNILEVEGNHGLAAYIASYLPGPEDRRP